MSAAGDSADITKLGGGGDRLGFDPAPIACSSIWRIWCVGTSFHGHLASLALPHRGTVDL